MHLQQDFQAQKMYCNFHLQSFAENGFRNHSTILCIGTRRPSAGFGIKAADYYLSAYAVRNVGDANLQAFINFFLHTNQTYILEYLSSKDTKLNLSKALFFSNALINT